MTTFFVGRNNDLGGYWALGLLYRDAPADLVVQLRLADGTASPSTPATMAATRNYAVFLRRALLKKGIAWDELAEANVEIRFTALPEQHFRGDLFTCTVTLASHAGRHATATIQGHCRRYEAGRFTARGGSDASVIASLV